MTKRKAPTREDASIFIGAFYAQHKRTPSAREMRVEFGNQGSLETYAALLHSCSDLAEANPITVNPVRQPDQWDELADVMRNMHAAEFAKREFKLLAQIKNVERERDEARDRLVRFEAGCKQNCRPVTFEWDDDDRNARAPDGSITLSVEEMMAIDRERRSAAAEPPRITGAWPTTPGIIDEEGGDVPF